MRQEDDEASLAAAIFKSGLSEAVSRSGKMPSSLPLAFRGVNRL